ncbi:MAG: NFACT family protein [Candidatus Heimdallarchaeota archaeon]|nr:MAG: NFACT family protein [Candidatus Heimdallarchaeota archaeon]
MSSLDIYAISKELQGIIGYRVDNVYRDLSDTLFLFKFKGKGPYKSPFLLIEPGIRLHLTEVKYQVPERPSDKIVGMRSHLKGAEVTGIRQIDFDRIVEISLRGKQQYQIFIEIFGNRPNLVIVGDQNRVISALWYKKMRHRDLLPGKEFELPPSRGKSILDMNNEEIKQIVKMKEIEKEKIIRTLAQKAGGGGRLMEEVLARANIPKDKMNEDIREEEFNRIKKATMGIKRDLEKLKPSVAFDSNEKPISFQPIDLITISGQVQYFESFSLAMDYYYTNITPKTSADLKRYDQKKKRLLKVLEAQKQTIEGFEIKKKYYKELGDKIYLQLNEMDELLSTILTARKKNIDWPEIQNKLAHAKENGVPSARILEKIFPERGVIRLNLDSEIIEVDFRKPASEIANGYYQRAKKAARKIAPAKEAILETERKIDLLSKDITVQRKEESISLKRRKRKWYEKYHWTKTQNRFLVIGGRDVNSNVEIVKRRMKEEDFFFHAEIRGAPYTILIRDSSDQKPEDLDLNEAALLAATFSSGWKEGYGAVDVYYVPARNTSFTAPSGEYIPKGGIMVRGTRKYVRGVEMALTLGIQLNKFNASVIYGSEETIRSQSPITITIKPGSVSKGKIAKHIRHIFIEKTEIPENKAKIKAIDLNEFVHAIPHNSEIIKVEYGLIKENSIDYMKSSSED